MAIKCTFCDIIFFKYLPQKYEELGSYENPYLLAQLHLKATTLNLLKLMLSFVQDI